MLEIKCTNYLEQNSENYEDERTNFGSLCRGSRFGI